MISSMSVITFISSTFIPSIIPFCFPTDVNGIILKRVLYSFSRLSSSPQSPPNIFLLFSSKLLGKISYSLFFSISTTGLLLIGSFNKFPVSSITLVFSSFPFRLITISYINSFFDILVFTTLKAIYVIANPTIPPSKAIFIGYVPMYTPSFIKISCGLTIYKSAKAHPPNANDTK